MRVDEVGPYRGAAYELEPRQNVVVELQDPPAAAAFGFLARPFAAREPAEEAGGGWGGAAHPMGAGPVVRPVMRVDLEGAVRGLLVVGGVPVGHDPQRGAEAGGLKGGE